tara:strand:- start:2825 stop:3667 length:843 start_codon:yes stop_codon:yes gene_type:complete
MDPISDIVWKKNFKINNWNVYGNSIGGLRTSFYISDLNVLLDAGYQNFNKPDNIFITHLHADHIASLHLTVLENNNSNIFTNIYCHLESMTFLEEFLKSFFKCNYNFCKINTSKIFKIHGLVPDERREIILNKKKFIVEAIKSHHVIPTLSYGFNFISKKLKEEFKGKNGKELAELKKNGIGINYELESPALLFIGDTDRNIFYDSKFYNYKNIIIECTFFDIKDIQSSNDRKHMHWTYLSKIISENKSIIFHIIHISPKNLKSYSDLIINEYENVQFLY